MKNKDIITVKAMVTVEVTYNKYLEPKYNTRANEQIKIWIKETLEDEDNIPLFVRSNEENYTLSKKVLVEIDDIQISAPR